MSWQLSLFGEGDGDENALPVLIRRLLKEKDAADFLWTDKGNFMRVGSVTGLLKQKDERSPANLARYLEFARKRGALAVLLVLDGDVAPAEHRSERCWPSTVARRLSRIAAAQAGAGKIISVATVFARVEYETWIVAGIESLSGRALKDGRIAVPAGLKFPGGDPESHGKAWLQRHVPGYRETRDQHMLTQAIDLQEVRGRGLRSFRRLEHALDQLILAARSAQHICTP